MSRLRHALLALTALVVAGAAHAQITLVATAQTVTAGSGATSVSVATPAGTIASDVMLAVVSVRGAAQSVNIPAGWNAVAAQESIGTYTQRVFWRVAVAGEPAAHTFSWTVSARGVAVILTYRGVDALAPIDASAGQAATSATITAPTITTTVANTTLVGFFGIANAGANYTLPSPAMTRVFAAGSEPNTGAGPNGTSVLVTEEPWPAASATGARAVTASVSASNAGRMVALRPVGLNHFAISHAGSGVACDSQAITITAHDAAHNPALASGLAVSLSTTNAKGTWVGIQAGGGTLSDPVPGDGAATYTFAAGSNSVTLLFSYANLAATPETFGFNVSGGGISETTGSAAATEDPSFTMSLAGFRFRNITDGNGTLVTQISGKPSNTGFNAKTVRLQAINTDTATGACINQFANQTQTVQLGGECNSPATCAGRQVAINGTNIVTSNDNGGAGAAAYTGVPLAFDANSESDTVIAYPDAGQISVHAGFDLGPAAGFEMIGSSNPFVVRPFGLAFPGVAHSNSAAGTLIGAAGDNFALTVQAYQWASGEDANGDGVPDVGINITDNGTVPNFAATAVVSPSANLPGVAPGSVSRGAGCASASSIVLAGGSASAADWCYSEAGNVLLAADVANYLAAGVNVTGSSGLDGDAGGGYVGRFKPKYFVVAGVSSLLNRSALACAPASPFTYMNEGLQLGFALEARNTQGALTQNYTGAYAKLNLATAASLGIGALSAGTNLTPRVDASLAPTGSFSNGVAGLTVTTGIRRASPDNPDGPYAGTQFGVAPNDGDPDAAGGVQLNAFDMDVDGVGGDDHFKVGASTELRFGRLRLQNAYGTGALVLPVPIELQYWNGSVFAVNAADSCTTLPRSAIALAFTAPLAPCNTAVNAATVPFASGVGTLVLSAPGAGAQGSVLLTPNLGTSGGSYCDPASYVAAGSAPLAYLLGRWNDADNPDGDGNTAYDDKPGGRASYGRYAQPRNFIFYRENY